MVEANPSSGAGDAEKADVIEDENVFKAKENDIFTDESAY